MTSSNLNHLPMAPPPNTIPLGQGFNKWIWTGGHRHSVHSGGLENKGWENIHQKHTNQSKAGGTILSGRMERKSKRITSDKEKHGDKGTKETEPVTNLP